MEHITILLVDDTPSNLAVLYDHLKTQGYRVLVADNGVDAIEKVNQIAITLVILDVRMPGMDGYETCRAIKLNSQHATLPIIFLSALNDVDDRLKGFEAGAVDYVTKPINALEVTSRINVHIKLAQLQQQLAAQNEALEEVVSARTVELRAANARLAAEVKHSEQQQIEKSQLLTLLEQQHSQLRAFTDWLLQSRPKTHTELGQLISEQFLSNWIDLGNEIDGLNKRVQQVGIRDREVHNRLTRMRMRSDKVRLNLLQMIHAKSSGKKPPVAPIFAPRRRLSDREQEVLVMLCNGASSAEIAEQLTITSVTVRSHRTRIMQKLGIHHLPGLVKYAIKNGYTDLNY